jgi:hypothetical protein
VRQFYLFLQRRLPRLGHLSETFLWMQGPRIRILPPLRFWSSLRRSLLIRPGGVGGRVSRYCVGTPAPSVAARMPRNNYEKKRLLFHSSHHWGGRRGGCGLGLPADPAMAMLGAKRTSPRRVTGRCGGGLNAAGRGKGGCPRQAPNGSVRKRSVPGPAPAAIVRSR